jgi:hypothetical protein
MTAPAWIAKLVRDGSVARSSVGIESESVLAQLTALGLVAEEAIGSRRRVTVRDVAELRCWVEATYPASAAAPLPGQRATNIARARSSKAGQASHSVLPFLLRWFGPKPHVSWADLTQRCGLVGITTDRVGLLSPPSPWTLLTVENPESFLATNYEPVDETILVVYTGGNIAGAVIKALTSIRPSPRRVVHFGDYDWSGLAIFRRIREALPQAQLYVPDEIDDLFAQFAGHRLVIGQPSLIPDSRDSDEVRRVIELVARHNAGLEQEIVPPPPL